MYYLDVAIELYLRDELRSLSYLVTPQGREMLLDTIIEHKRNFISWLLSIWLCGVIGIIAISMMMEMSTELLLKWILFLLGLGGLLYGWGLIQIRYLSKLSSQFLNGNPEFPPFYLSSSSSANAPTSSCRNHSGW